MSFIRTSSVLDGSRFFPFTQHENHFTAGVRRCREFLIKQLYVLNVDSELSYACTFFRRIILDNMPGPGGGGGGLIEIIQC